MTAQNNPLAPLRWNADLSHEVPDVIEFVVSDQYLNRPLLYPRQATILKAIFLQDELFTQYDYDVLGEWAEGFREPDPELLKTWDDERIYRYDGNNGIQPDILERIAQCKAEHRKWFHEVVTVIGRRGSKGHLGGYCGSYVLWHYIARSDPQDYYGVDRDQQMEALVFAAKKEQARDRQWRNLTNFIAGSNCFTPYISRHLREEMTVFAPHDEARMFDRIRRGLATEDDMATFGIYPKESTQVSGRGGASFMLFFDEMAWVVKGVANATAEDVYEQATPSLDQFGVDGFIYEGSSPWQMMGQFYTNWEHALEIDPQTRKAAYPEMLMVQLESWDPYKDWEDAHHYERVPLAHANKKTFHLDDRTGEPKCFKSIKRPMQTYDAAMERLEKSNPETFAVERRAHWAAALNAYLNMAKVEAMFGTSWDGLRLEMQERGILSRTYIAHGDPSKSGANFGFSIAHTEGPDEDGLLHVVFDVVHAWLPSEWPDGQQNYIKIEEALKDYIKAFIPDELTFDQFNSIGTIQRLQVFVHEQRLPKGVAIYERTATHAKNWTIAETFKTALNMGLVHAPHHALAQLELQFLQDLGNHKIDHPTSGPVQTKDVADTLMICTYALIGEQMAPFLKQMLGEMELHGAMQGGTLPGGAMASNYGDQFSAAGRAAGNNPARGSRGRPMPPPTRGGRGMPGHGGGPGMPRRRG